MYRPGVLNRDLTPSTRRLLDGVSLVDLRTGEEAINRGLAKRLDQLANERERREKAARAEDENFSVEFLSAARKVFEMIDVDESGTLEKEEVVVAIRGNKKVINFLVNCGNKNLQYLLVPARLEAALAAMDTDHDGTIDADEWCVLESATLGRLRRGDGVLVAHRSMFRAGRSASRSRSKTNSRTARLSARSMQRGPRRRSRNLRTNSKTPRVSASR